MNQKRLFSKLFLICSFLTFFSCRHSSFEALKENDKDLVENIITELKLNEDSSVIDGKSGYYRYLENFVHLPTFSGITKEEAAQLKATYDQKRAFIEKQYGGGNVMRKDPITNNQADVQRVWIPVDQFDAYYQNLVSIEAKNRTKTGIEIYFGSYPYDKNRDDSLNPNGSHLNGDLFSGRSTLFFVGTADIKVGATDYNVLRQKEIHPLTLAIGTAGVVPDYNNHGTLCPDSCANP
jgi:hypothetical protein